MNPPESQKHMLSKSTFIRGLQCPKSLWLYKHHYKLRDIISLKQESIFVQGTNIGLLARQLFDGGIDASPPDNFNYLQSVNDTYKYINEEHEVIYEAAFQSKQVLAAIDLLVKRANKWYAFEVKSTTSVKKEHLIDAALQYFIITNCGIELSDFFIIHLNRKYKKNGYLDIHSLFTEKSVLSEILSLQVFIKDTIKQLLNCTQSDLMPSIGIGMHCYQPYPCDFLGTCWKQVPENSIFELCGRGGFSIATELYKKGIKNFENLPEGLELDADQYKQIESYLTNTPIIEKEEIRSFFNSLSYPLHFLHIEEFSTAIPEYDNTSPYQHLPFQYSLLILQETGEIQKFSFISEFGKDPRIQFSSSLLFNIHKSGSIVVYDSNIMQVLKLLIGHFPEFANQLNEFTNRVVDASIPIKNKSYYNSLLKGGYDKNKVIPSFVPQYNYESCKKNFGLEAGQIFINISKQEDDKMKDEIKAKLVEYSNKEAEGIFIIWKGLKDITLN